MCSNRRRENERRLSFCLFGGVVVSDLSAKDKDDIWPCLWLFYLSAVTTIAILFFGL